MSNLIVKNLCWINTKLICRKNKRDANLWVLGEWFGNRCCDNSMYFANYVAKNHPEIKLVWLAKRGIDTSLLVPTVRVVEMDTTEAILILKKAGVAIMNQGLNDFYKNIDFHCEGAITVNLWHGVPWKKIGIDTQQKDNILKRLYGRYMLNLQRVDYYLALSESFAKILKRSYYLEDDRILRTGYPRNSIFYKHENVVTSRAKVLSLLREKSDIISETTRLVTYMPTFRDHTEKVFSFEELEENTKLHKLLDEQDVVIIQKAHFVSQQRNSKGKKCETRRIVAINDISAQELLAASDMLITDYSSCFFDFLLTDKPIIHYLYDYEYYANDDRGLYYVKEDVVCGDSVETIDELLQAIEDNLKFPDKNALLRQCRREQFMTYESANSCKIIYEAICEKLKQKEG